MGNGHRSALSALMILACAGVTCAQAATFGESDRWPVQHPVNSFSSTEEVLRTRLGAHLGADINALCARISDRGSIDEQNLKMREPCLLFARLYHLTNERQHADKAARLLQRYAEVIPDWPLYLMYPKPEDVGRPFPQEGEGFYREWDAQGLWGRWIYYDLNEAAPLLEAYDYIYPSGAMQDLGALDAIEAMFYRHVALQRRYGTNTFGNVDHAQIRGFVRFAKVLGHPEWVHECVLWVKRLYECSFYADGWWHEGSAGYHNWVHQEVTKTAKRMLTGYSDPPGFVSMQDGRRYDDLDIMEIMERPFRRADEVLEKIAQPNGLSQVLHDDTYPRKSPIQLEEGRDVLFGCYGHGILATGSGENIVQASLHFSGTHGHEHFDCLNLILFAKGKELISETQYRADKVENSTREWHTSTAGHATVVIDERDQTGRLNRHTYRRERQPEDAVEGVVDWRYRWMGHGNALNDGKLRLFNTDFEWVKVAEADGERSWGTLLDVPLYRRTIALVKIDESDCYLVDIFRVRGGKTHDYMLHGCLDEPYSASTSIPMVQGYDAYHKYIVDPMRGQTDGGWACTFTMEDGTASMKSFFLPQQGTEVFLGRAPAMRRLGTAWFLDVAQYDGESTFVVVHHPYATDPIVQRVEAVPLRRSRDDMAVAIRVTLPNRIDTIISTAEDRPRKTIRTEDGTIRMRGRFAHVAEGRENWAYLIQGDRLVCDDREIKGNVSHEGVVRKTYRVGDGDPCDAFVTHPVLPDDGSLDGRTLMVDEGGLLVQSFRIESIERRNGETLIHSEDEPGMSIMPGLVKQRYYPCLGIRGEARYTIAGSALLRQDPGGGAWRVRASAPVKAEVHGKRVPQQ